ncbi:MAG: hypothetical protein ACU0FO_03725 [Pseudooceanicola nanhaiensis]
MMLANTAQAASFRSSFFGEFTVSTENGDETYHVFRELDDEQAFRYAPSELKLSSGQGAPVSTIVAQSLIFDDAVSAGFTFVLQSNSSAEGLVKLKAAVAEKSGVTNPVIGAIGSIEYKLYIYVVVDGISDQGYAVRKIDQGTRTVDSSIAATLKIDSIDEASLRNLLEGEDGVLLIAYVQSFPVSYEVGLDSTGSAPAELLQLFSSSRSLPLEPIYQNELANSAADEVPEIADRLKSIAPSIFGSTPALDLETLALEWVVNEERLQASASQPKETYILRATDLAKSTLRVPGICATFPQAVIDADGLGVGCE